MSISPPRTALGAVAVMLAIAVLAASGQSAPAQSVPSGGPPPKRTYVMVLDGLRPGDVRPDLMPNVSALRAQGTWYEEARSVFVAETLPNHAAMMTGVLPNRNGIVGNRFERRNVVGGFFDERTMQDPRLFQTDTLVTRLERSCGRSISTATVLSKDYLYELFKGEDHPGDPNRQLEADFHWDPRESVFVPVSNHTLDAATMQTFAPWARSAPTPQFAFVNLGDIDRSQHADEGGNHGPAGTASMRDTDLLVGQFVDELKANGWWDETALILLSDHGMDWSLPDHFIDTQDALQRAGFVANTQFRVGNNGGADMIYLFESDPQKRATMIETVKALPGVEFVLTDRTGINDPRELPRSLYGLNHRYAGDLIAMAKPGWRFNTLAGSNHIPGNHGHAITQHGTLLVTGGHPSLATAGPGAVANQSIAGPAIYPSATGRPPAPQDGPGTMSVASTVGALLGLPTIPGGYDGPPLTEAFDPGALAGGSGICEDIGAEDRGAPEPAPSGGGGAPLLTTAVDVSSASADQGTYDLVVSNRGSATATGVRLTDTVPADLTFVSSDPAPSPPAGGTTAACENGGSPEPAGVVCEWALGDLPPGGSATVKVTFKLPDLLAPFANSFTVENTAVATAAGGLTSSDSDRSLSVWETDDFFISDTHVDRGEPQGTNHGACNSLRVGADDPATPQDETTTAFVRTFNEDIEWTYIRSAVGRIERMWAGQLHATVAGAPSAPTRIGAHGVSTEWLEGGGSCAGQQGSADQPRTGFVPVSATGATAITEIPAAAGADLTWDVTADIDTPAERADNKGWELTDHGSILSPAPTSTVLYSAEDTTRENRPRVRFVFTVGEAPTCVDADPETATVDAPEEALVSARVTDGDKVSNASGDDACTGTPTGGERVEWEIEDDTPDAYIARRADSARASTPNIATRATNANGVATISVRLAQSGGELGDSRIAARLEDAPDPEACAQAPCPTEAAAEDDASVTWQAPRYPRPVSARTMNVSLVPAYDRCESPNRTHGPPLDSRSCAPPRPSSADVTVGGKSTGNARLATLVGSPSTPADEADVKFTFSLSDVRRRSDASDYAGPLKVAFTTRITDKDGPATVSDFPFQLDAQCASTPAAEGGSCVATTTFDAVMPGVIDEGARAIWQVGTIEVLDPSGAVLARQGVFVP